MTLSGSNLWFKGEEAEDGWWGWGGGGELQWVEGRPAGWEPACPGPLCSGEALPSRLPRLLVPLPITGRAGQELSRHGAVVHTDPLPLTPPRGPGLIRCRGAAVGDSLCPCRTWPSRLAQVSHRAKRHSTSDTLPGTASLRGGGNPKLLSYYGQGSRGHRPVSLGNPLRQGLRKGLDTRPGAGRGQNMSQTLPQPAPWSPLHLQGGTSSSQGSCFSCFLHCLGCPSPASAMHFPLHPGSTLSLQDLPNPPPPPPTLHCSGSPWCPAQLLSRGLGH